MTGIEPALLFTAFVFGLRHGVDWDHIAAITDITASQISPRRGFVLATLYAVGHALVVLGLGVLAIRFGALIPDRFEAIMERVVGVTLLVLGSFVFYSLIRHGKAFRMRSRWMLILAGVRRGFLWLIGSSDAPAEIEHEHQHASGAHEHEPDEPAGEAHRHRHRHTSKMPSAPFMEYGAPSALAIGAIHGIGAETPTQVLLFLAAGGVATPALGLAILIVFLIGLLATNSVVAAASAFGMMRQGSSRVYVAVGVLTGGASLILGGLYVLGFGSRIPTLL